MQKLIHRLEAIKLAISLDDEELIEFHSLKIKKLNINKNIENILSLLENINYGEAILKIEDYIKKYSGVQIYQDKELIGLKMELKTLEIKLQDLNSIKNNYFIRNNEFNTQYNLELYDILNEILEIKQRMALNKKYYKEYEETKKEYEDFNKIYEEEIKKSKILNEDEKKELKKAYRKASKLCHPDLVSDDIKKDAEKVFKELNKAYKDKNLLKVKEILKSLENEYIFETNSDKIEDKDLLNSKIIEFREKIKLVQEEIYKFENSDIFKIIEDKRNWDNFFKEAKKELEIDLNDLKEKEDKN